ncbi:hypothetical protein [Rugamonas violacea]|nr:hypothetical protein [Rugamonas sp. CCM 8940]
MKLLLNYALRNRKWIALPHQPLRGRHGRLTDKNAVQHFGHIMTLLAQGIEARATETKIIGAVGGAEVAGDFLLDLGHAYCQFDYAVAIRDGGVRNEEQNGIGMQEETAQQVVDLRLFTQLITVLADEGLKLCSFAHDRHTGRDGAAAEPMLRCPDQSLSIEQQFHYDARPSLASQTVAAHNSPAPAEDGYYTTRTSHRRVSGKESSSHAPTRQCAWERCRAPPLPQYRAFYDTRSSRNL